MIYEVRDRLLEFDRHCFIEPIPWDETELDNPVFPRFDKFHHRRYKEDYSGRERAYKARVKNNRRRRELAKQSKKRNRN